MPMLNGLEKAWHVNPASGRVEGAGLASLLKRNQLYFTLHFLVLILISKLFKQAMLKVIKTKMHSKTAM